MPQIHVEQMGYDQEKFPMLSDETQEPGHIQKEALDGLKPTMDKPFPEEGLFQEMTNRSCGYFQRRACHTTAVMCPCDFCAVNGVPCGVCKSCSLNVAAQQAGHLSFIGCFLYGLYFAKLNLLFGKL